MREDCAYKYPLLSIARYSFRQLSVRQQCTVTKLAQFLTLGKSPVMDILMASIFKLKHHIKFHVRQRCNYCATRIHSSTNIHHGLSPSACLSKPKKSRANELSNASKRQQKIRTRCGVGCSNTARLRSTQMDMHAYDMSILST